MFMIFSLFSSVIAAIVLGFIVIPKVVKVAIKKDLVAKPNHRTSHVGRIPNVGGISIFISFILAFILSSALGADAKIQYLLFTVLVLFFVGLYDDIMIISAKRKLIGELCGISVMIFLGDFRLTNLHGFFGIYELSYIVSLLLTFFVTVVIINALNLIDGIDGLASGVGMIISLFFGFYFYLVGREQLAIVAFSLLGALVPFFIYNVFAKRNKIFMGDAGALVLGVVLAALTISFNEVNISPSSSYHIINAPMVSICILVLPMFDTIRVFTIRIMQKRSPFSPDKNHLHHMFLALGYNHKQSTGILLLINLIYIVIGLVFQYMPKFFFFTVIFLSCVLWSETLRALIKAREKEKCDEVFS
ncbi:MAG: undecaprenyl/decaprenyl-phosphate alpha-N-acetylglucosaminyl 1-phosphate transferase [Prevotellaceae bacterium]|jgi:UDP-N-acetylmuramyl pentapeptide phosphotransferase/UDP-N-acetylglucosamine-1-phosphate transferase|nr:undecaprenyl/decaprenyl-phosphate alpha-N-acetylglucosaminyl 1-phosphate transferase [Prevotellaceae bacterium]